MLVYKSVMDNDNGGGSNYTAGDGIDITNDIISTKQSEEGDIDEIIDVYPQSGNLVSIVNAFNRGDIYSTDEKMIGQWVDGKPLYQKTIVDTLASQPSSGTVGTKHIAIDASVEFGYIADLTIKDGGNHINAFYIKDDMAIFLKAFVRSNSSSTNPNCVSVMSKAWFDSPCYITVRYTKTTDTAISIGSETEYSTTEKVVGTWIDGKPLWQKTFAVNITINNAWCGNVNVSDCNIEEIKSSFASGTLSNQKISMYPVIRIQNGVLDLWISNMNNVVINQITIQYTKTTT